ncbi:hypothetical protein Tco_0106496, partial [Tanacetum coccineum]
HEDAQLYGAILPDELTNEAIKDSESYKEYYAITSGTPPTAKGKRLKTSAKGAKPAKKKQLAKTSKAKGLTVLSEFALTEAEQMDDEEDDYEVAMSGDDNDDADNQDDDNNDDDDQNDDNTDNENDDDDGQDHDDQNDDNTNNENDNDGDDFVHPKFSTHNEEEGPDLRVQTPSHYESIDD